MTEEELIFEVQQEVLDVWPDMSNEDARIMAMNRLGLVR